MQFTQHLGSNVSPKALTDHYLLPETQDYSMLQDNLDEIRYLKEHYEAIDISDREIEDIRAINKNSLTRGNVLSIILAERFRGYKGLDKDNGEDYDKHEGVDEEINVKQKNIFTSLYDHVEGIQYFFLK